MCLIHFIGEGTCSFLSFTCIWFDLTSFNVKLSIFEYQAVTSVITLFHPLVLPPAFCIKTHSLYEHSLYAAMQSFKHVKVPSLSSLYTLDGRLPTLTSDDYNRIPRLRRHKWTPAEKQVLYLLNSHYANNPHGELWTVFNVFFKERRPRWVGPRRTAWETMRVFMMNPVRFRVWWTGAEARRVRGEIERVALRVGVRLLGKGPLMPVRGRGKRRGPGCVSSVAADGLHSVRSMSPEQEGTVGRKLFDADNAPGGKRARVTTNGLLTPPPTVKKKGNWKSNSEMDIPVPAIAFRGMQSSITIRKNTANLQN